MKCVSGMGASTQSWSRGLGAVAEQCSVPARLTSSSAPLPAPSTEPGRLALNNEVLFFFIAALFIYFWFKVSEIGNGGLLMKNICLGSICLDSAVT